MESSNWHLAETDIEKDIADFELALWHLIYSFFNWQEQCQATSSGQKMSAERLSIFHVMGMYDKPKTYEEIAAILQQNSSPVRHQCRELEKHGFATVINKSGRKFYTLTKKGKEAIRDNVEVRKATYIALFEEQDTKRYRKTLKKLRTISITMRDMCDIYAHAERRARLYRPDSTDENE